MKLGVEQENFVVTGPNTTLVESIVAVEINRPMKQGSPSHTRTQSLSQAQSNAQKRLQREESAKRTRELADSKALEEGPEAKARLAEIETKAKQEARARAKVQIERERQ